MKRSAFTMIELVVVIVILGILSSIAVSKMAVTRDDAQITKGRSEIAALRNAIILYRNTNMLKGNGAKYPSKLDALSTATSSDGNAIFGYDSNDSKEDNKLLDYPVYAKDTNGHWRKVANNKYSYKITNLDVNFTYIAKIGKFDCKHGIANGAQKLCKSLTE